MAASVKLRILHLEDDPNDSFLVEALLAQEGIECELDRVESREEFQTALDQQELDLILADYSLPSFDGMSALAMALERLPDVPFILLSGTAGEEVAAESVKSGATDYVLKDRPSRLVYSIRRALREADERRDRRRVKESLRDSEERLRTVIQHMPVLMVAFDRTSRIIAWNHECERVTGYSAAEIVGNPKAMDLLFPSLEQRRIMAAEWCRPSKDYRDREFQISGKTGQSRTVTWSNISQAFPVPAWSSWTIGLDVTEARRAQTEREQFQSKLRQTQKLESLGLLAGGIAHDFNNLLTAILGNAGLALLRLDPGNSAYELIQRLVNASERAAELTRQMLAYAGQARFEIRPILLSEHILETTRHLSAAVSKKVSFDLQLADGLPAIKVDPAQIQQLVMNLIINAAEACGDRSGTVRIKTGLATSAPPEESSYQFAIGENLGPGTHVYLEVADNGCGMDPETLEKIFDPFYTTKFTGRGLGLSTVLGIVRAHHGSLQVRSAPGEGSTFRVRLPGVEQTQGTSPATPKPDALKFRPATILVVDDEPSVLEIARSVLEGCGHHVLTAENGRRGLDLFQKKFTEIDLVLLDKTMPDLDGEEAFQAMKAIDPDVVAVLTSGYQETEVASQLLANELAGFVQKPYLPHTLATKIQDALLQGGRRSAKGSE